MEERTRLVRLVWSVSGNSGEVDASRLSIDACQPLAARCSGEWYQNSSSNAPQSRSSRRRARQATASLTGMNYELTSFLMFEEDKHKYEDEECEGKEYNENELEYGTRTPRTMRMKMMVMISCNWTRLR